MNNFIDNFISQNGLPAAARHDLEVFCEYLLHKYRPDTQAAIESPPSTEPPPARILVIDDSPPIRELITRALTSKGHFIQTAANGKEAYAMIADGPFDLIITDILMPEEDGLMLIKKTRQGGHPTPIICISAGDASDSSEAYLRCAQDLGANYTLSKPLNTRKLLEAVRACLTPP